MNPAEADRPKAQPRALIARGHPRLVAEETVRTEVRIAVRAELNRILELLLGIEPPYSTHRGGPRPDGFVLRAWQRVAPTIPGAVRRGRYVLVSREAFAAWERASCSAAPATAPLAPDEEWTPAKALAAAGVRRTT
jgi:hypothetical protein